MKKRKLTFGLLAIGFALLSQSAAAQEVCGTARLVSNQPAGTPITLRVNNNYYGVVVDWGDGNPITYNDRTKAVREITGKVVSPEDTIVVTGYSGWDVLDCTGCSLTHLDITGATNLKSLFASDNQLTTLNLKGQTKMVDLHVANNQLTTLEFTDPKKPELDIPVLETLDWSNNHLQGTFVVRSGELQYANIANNGFTIIYTTANPKLKTFICSGNEVKTLSMTSNKDVTTLVVYNNPLTKFTTPTDLSKVEQLICANVPLTKLDLSGATSLYDLDCSNCGLTTLLMPSKTRMNTLNVSNNKLSLGVLPLSTFKPNQLSFEPQGNVDISGATGLKVTNGVLNIATTVWANRTKDVVDLGTYRYIGANEANPISDNTFEWISVDEEGNETTLVAGTSTSASNDYYGKNGKFAFFTPHKKAYAKITSKTYQVSVNTVPIAIGSDLTRIESATTEGTLELRSTEYGVWISGDNTPVNIFTLDGRKVWNGVAVQNGVHVNLDKGAYLINGKKVVK